MFLFKIYKLMDTVRVSSLWSGEHHKPLPMLVISWIVGTQREWLGRIVCSIWRLSSWSIWAAQWWPDFGSGKFHFPSMLSLVLAWWITACPRFRDFRTDIEARLIASYFALMKAEGQILGNSQRLHGVSS